MSDCSPLRLADNGDPSSQSQSSGGSRNELTSGHEANSRLTDLGKQRRSNDNNNPNRRTQQQQQQLSTANHRIDFFNDGDRVSVARSPSVSESTKSGQLRYDARNVIELFIPVSLCMLIVVGTMKITDSYRYSSQTIIWYAQVMFTDQTVDTGTRVWQSFANAFIMLILIAVMTTVLILLYKFRCYKTIHGWLILSSLVLLFMFAIMYIAEILKVYNVPLDVYTLMFAIWNFGVVGMICIHWKGPLLLQQGYLIVISALLALIFIRSLPDWTTWTVLGIVSIWDLIAVLCPRGPLRILVETAQKRNEPIFPALIYSSTMLWEFTSTVIVSVTPSISMADRNPSGSRSNRRQQRSNRDGGNNRQRSTESTTSNQRRQNSGNNAKRRAQQHPVEIHYDGEQQAPEVDIIQPSLSGTSGDWDQPTVRTHRIIVENNPTDGVITSRGNRSRDDASRRPEGDLRATSVEFHSRSENETVEVLQMEEERGVKLGLGDFIFYSLLVGKASTYGDWIITLSCYVAILVGLCLTLALLAVFRKALPALPISIAFGLSSFFMSYTFAMPFAGRLASNQVFV